MIKKKNKKNQKHNNKQTYWQRNKTVLFQLLQGIHDPDNTMCSSEVKLLIFSMPLPEARQTGNKIKVHRTDQKGGDHSQSIWKGLNII